MAAIRLRCKSKSGQCNLPSCLTEDSTLGELVAVLETAVGLESSNFGALLVGYPPQPISVADRTLLLKELPIRSGDTVIVQETIAPVIPLTVEETPILPLPQLHVESVPANNSCLFTSIALCLNKGVLNLEAAQPLRDMVADAVQTDPSYSEAVLGQPPADYAKWIRKSDSWGGGVELAVLSTALGLELTVVDTISRDNDEGVQRFGVDGNHKDRIFLLYDGTHYDPLVKTDQWTFPVSDNDFLSEASKVAAKVKKERGNLADLQCQICGASLAGPQEAARHTMVTKHDKFVAKKH